MIKAIVKEIIVVRKTDAVKFLFLFTVEFYDGLCRIKIITNTPLFVLIYNQNNLHSFYFVMSMNYRNFASYYIKQYS